MLREDAADLLEKAADLIETVGHTKHMYTKVELVDPTTDPNSASSWKVVAFCAVGAINAAHTLKVQQTGQRITELHPALAVFSFALKQVCLQVEPVLSDQPMAGIARWNDRPERTPGEVVDVLKSVAKDLRNAA